MGCGASMGTAPMTAEPEAPPPSSRPPAPGAARMSAVASFAEILGLPADASVPAQKAALLDFRQVFDHASKLTAQSAPGAVVGGLTVMARDAADSGRLRAERNALRQKQEHAERFALADRLVACGGATRGKVFLDDVNADGTRKVVDGKPVVKLTRVYAEMRLDTLRGEVEGYERSARPRDPFVADRNAAETAAKNVRRDGLSPEARLEAAKKDPTVIRLAQQSGHPIEAVAAQWLKTLDAQNGVAS
jgi:hypothetical protein